MHGHAISAHDLAPSSRTKKNSAHHFLMARNIFGPEATQNLQHLYISHEHASTCIIMRMHHDNTLVPSATFIIMMHHAFTVKNDVYYYDALDPGTTCNFYYYDDAFSCKGSRPLGATFSKRQLGRGGGPAPPGAGATNPRGGPPGLLREEDGSFLAGGNPRSGASGAGRRGAQQRCR